MTRDTRTTREALQVSREEESVLVDELDLDAATGAIAHRFGPERYGEAPRG